MRVLRIFTVFTLLSTMVGCAGMTERQQRTLSGGAIGAGGGALFGAITGGSPAVGAAVGGGVGALGGYLLGGEEHRRR